MKQGKDASSGSRLKVGGVPCEVVYRGPESEPAVVHPVSVRPGVHGSFQWDPRFSGSHEPPSDRKQRALLRREATPSLLQLEGPEAQGELAPAQGDFQKLHQILRGRYLLALALAVVLGVVGVWAGYRFGHKSYQSTGLVTITPIRLFASPDSPQSLDQFMLAQAAKFKSQRVLDNAIMDKRWQDNLPSDFEARLARDLEVTQQGQMLIVKFVDPDSQVATLAVDASTQAFRQIFGEEQRASGVVTTGSLTLARADLNAKLTTIQGQIDDEAGLFGADALEVRRDIKLQELHEVEVGLNSLDLMQVQISAMPSPKVAPTTAPAGDVPVEEIAKADMLMSSLLSRRAQLQQQIGEMTAAGALDKLPKLEQAKALLSSVEDDIRHRTEDWRQTHEVTRGTIPADVPATQYLNPQEISARSHYFQGRKTAVEEELKTLREQIGRIAKLKIQRDRVMKDLNTAEEEIQQDEIEKTKWRVDVTDADRPLEAFRDTRISLAGAGGLGGILTGFGLVLLLGLIDRRVRDPGDAAGGLASAPILGMLPQLPDDLGDPEQAAQAAHSVHEIRTLLQILGRGLNHQVFGVTSPVPGSGKTSLTLALGVSFAAAKFKTLLLDCDLVGGGLSTRVNAIIRRRIGAILSRQGCISEPQLRQALEAAQNSGRRLGETLVEMGCVSQEDLEAALAAQAGEQVGLLDALDGEPVENCVVKTGIPGLWVLPLGSATARDAGTLSPDSLRQVIELTRSQFDVVLVDTGPVLGSLEASVTASQVDAVVMTVARGDRGPDLQRAITHLRSLGARMAGLVFNRARKQDVDRYGSSRIGSSNGGWSRNSRGSEPAAAGERSARLGPVACAVNHLHGG